MSVDTVAFYIVFGSGSVRTVWILRKCNCGGSSTLNRIVKCNRKLLTCRLRLCTCVEKSSVKRAKVLLSALRRCWIGNFNNGYISHAYACRCRRVTAQETRMQAGWLLGCIACITWEFGMLDAALDATDVAWPVRVCWTHWGSPAKTENRSRCRLWCGFGSAQGTIHSPGSLVFWRQRSPRNSTEFTPYGGAECRWGGSKSATLDK